MSTSRTGSGAFMVFAGGFGLRSRRFFGGGAVFRPALVCCSVTAFLRESCLDGFLTGIFALDADVARAFDAGAFEVADFLGAGVAFAALRVALAFGAPGRCVVLLAGLFAVVAFLPTVFFGADFFGAGFFGVVLFGAGFLAAGLRDVVFLLLAGFFAVLFFAAGLRDVVVLLLAGFFVVLVFAAVFFAAGRFEADCLAVVFVAGDWREAGLRLVAGFFALLVLAAGFLAAGLFAAGFLAVVFLAVVFLAVVFLVEGLREAVVLLAAGFLAVVLFAAGFLARLFFALVVFTADFLAGAFRAVDFFAADFRAPEALDGVFVLRVARLRRDALMAASRDRGRPPSAVHAPVKKGPAHTEPAKRSVLP